MLAIPGGFSRNLHAAIPALTSQALTTASQFNTWGLYSIVPKTVGLFLGPSHAGGLANPHGFELWALPFAYLLLLFVVIWRQRVPQWCWGPLSLASLQLIPPLSAVYTTGWACLAAIWYCVGSITEVGSASKRGLRQPREDVPLRILVGLAIAASLVPSAFTLSGAGGLSIVATVYLSPALLLIALCLAVAKSLSKSAPTDDLVTEDPVSEPDCPSTVLFREGAEAT